MTSNPTDAAPLSTPPLPKVDAWSTFQGGAPKGPLAGLLCLDDFEARARSRLPRPIFGYVAGAAERNRSLRDNAHAFDDWAFLPRVLQNVAQRDTSVELFGTRYSAPFGVAPMGIAALSAYDGDRALARAAQAQGVAAVLSGSSLTRMEDVLAAAPGTWFQAYLPGSIERIDALLARVKAAGAPVLVVTVDIPVAGNRENNLRAGFSTPLKPSLRLAWDGLTHPRWLLGTALRTLLTRGMPHFENSFAERGAPILSSRVARDFAQRDHFDWSHIAHIRRVWAGPLVVKGLLHPQDAVRAAQLGVDGVVVSNHGGRQLDGAVAPLRVLPQVVDAVHQAVGHRTVVMLDGGIRRGTDVLKALALGARMVWVGRPFNHAAAVAGEAGVRHAMQLLHAEVDRNMAMLGVTRCDQLGPQHLMPVNPPTPRPPPAN